MIEKLKEMPELKLGLTIAGGIFVGLLAYRLLIASIDWWALGWINLSAQQHAELRVAIAVPACASVFYLLRKITAREQRLYDQRCAKARIVESAPDSRANGQY